MIYLTVLLLMISSVYALVNTGAVYALVNTDDKDLSEYIIIFNIVFGGGLLFVTSTSDISSLWLLIYCLPTLILMILLSVESLEDANDEHDYKEFIKYYTSQLTDYCNKNGNTVPKYIYDSAYHFFKHKNFINYDLSSVVSFVNKYSVFKPDSEILIAICAYDIAVKKASQLVGE